MIVLNVGKYLFAFLSAFLATFVLTPLVERIAPRLSLVDMPEARRVHRRPTPTCGGIAVFAGFHVGCAAIFLMPWPFFEGHIEFGWWWRFLILSSILLAVGLVDDARNIRPLLKLLGQTLVAVLAFCLDMRVGNVLNLELRPAFDLLATVFWFLALINAFNLIDGMDGLAAGLAAIASLGLASSFVFRREPRDTMVMLSLLGACLAFLRYNFYPARIFLGDAGSMFLGLALAAVPLSTNAKGTLMASLGVPLLAVGVPVFDTMLAVWRRSVRRAMAKREGNGNNGTEGRLMQADLDHLHHRLARRGLSQRSVATWLYALNAALVVLGILLLLYRSHSLGILTVAFVAAVYVIVRHLAHVELWDSGRMIVDGLHRPPARVLPFIIYPMMDLALLASSSLAAIWLANVDAGFKAAVRLWVAYGPLWIGLPFLALMVAGVYKRVWSRARVTEYVIAAVALAAGTVLCGGTTYLFHGYDDPRVMMRALLYGLFAVPLVAGERALPRVIQDAYAYARREKLHGSQASHNILLYGAGYRATLFLRAKSFDNVGDGKPTVVVGFIDDDSNLHGRLVHGYPVLGGTVDLGDILDRHTVHEIIIAADIDEKPREDMIVAARASGVKLSEWRIDLVPVVPA